MHHKQISLIVLITQIAMFVASTLFALIKGFDITAEMDKSNIPLYIEPAGYAFIIWQFIYIGSILLGIYQLKSEQINQPRYIYMRPYLIINALSNILWFFGVIYNVYWITVLFMLSMLYTLIKISYALNFGRGQTNNQEKYMVVLPVSLYFGWITIATPINITAWLLKEVGWSGQAFLNPVIWSTLILSIAFSIVVYLYLKRLVNGVFVCVIIWALIAVSINNSYHNSFFISIIAIVLSIALLALLTLFKGKNKAIFL